MEGSGIFAELLAMGFWFWTISLAELILFTVLVCNKRFFSPIVSLLVLTGIYQFLFKLNVIGAIVHNPLWIIGAISVYIIGGIPWSFARWMRLVSKRANIYNKVKTAWLKKNGVQGNEIPDSLKNKWIEFFAKGRSFNNLAEYVNVGSILNSEEYNRLVLDYDDLVYRVPPKAREHKGDILFWIAYWPIDMFWLIFHDLIVDFANTVYAAVSGTYQRIANKKFESATNDFAKKTDDN